jgi:hypothetical protein
MNVILKQVLISLKPDIMEIHTDASPAPTLTTLFLKKRKGAVMLQNE